MAVYADWNYVFNFQEKVQQLERQLKEMEREKERELNALRKEKRELIHTTQTVRWINNIVEYCYIYHWYMVHVRNTIWGILHV